jgi:N-acetylglucosaminyldiphosphoundecaprenol N-acetyl-beta-D-mannosaminyltransferase
MKSITPDVSANRNSILGMKVIISHNYYWDCRIVIEWAKKSESKYICCANAHMLVIAQESREFRDVITSADLVTLDGRPVFWVIYVKNILYYFLGYSPLQNNRIMQFCGRDVMEETIKLASALSIPIGFYGNRKEVLDSLISKIKKKYPEIAIDYAFSPPFRSLSIEEEMAIVSTINKSNIRILFVSLGCPKQEYWMCDKKNIVQAVMIGVGGAFEVVANPNTRPSKLVQNLGFEWLFRLSLEPKRLIYRNLYHSPKFILILSTRIIFKSIRHLLSKVHIKFNISR